MEQLSTQTRPSEKEEAEHIRNIWRKKRPPGLSKREVETMPDSHVIDLYDVLNEPEYDDFDFDEFETPTCDCCGKKMKKK